MTDEVTMLLAVGDVAGWGYVVRLKLRHVSTVDPRVWAWRLGPVRLVHVGRLDWIVYVGSWVWRRGYGAGRA